MMRPAWPPRSVPAFACLKTARRNIGRRGALPRYSSSAVSHSRTRETRSVRSASKALPVERDPNDGADKQQDARNRLDEKAGQALLDGSAVAIEIDEAADDPQQSHGCC